MDRPEVLEARRSLPGMLCLQAVVPRSSKQERIAANRALDFELSDQQMRRIDALDSIITPEAV